MMTACSDAQIIPLSNAFDRTTSLTARLSFAVFSMYAGTLPAPTPSAGLPHEYAARTIALPPVARMRATPGWFMSAEVAAGAPENCIQWVEEPSLAATSALMNHPGVALILATGGNAMVRAAYSCGKPALGVGAGNVPAYIEKTAKLKRAVNDVVLSKAFDNGMICASEQAVIIDDEIYDAAMAEFD